MSGRLVRLVLELIPGEPIAGCLRGADGTERRFVGWLELLAAVEFVGATAGEEGREKE